MIKWVVYIWEHHHELWETLQGIFFKFWHYKNQTTNQLIERNFSRISLLSHMNKKCILGSLRAHFNINLTLISQKSINLSAVPPKNGNTQYGYQFKFSFFWQHSLQHVVFSHDLWFKLLPVRFWAHFKPEDNGVQSWNVSPTLKTWCPRGTFVKFNTDPLRREGWVCIIQAACLSQCYREQTHERVVNGVDTL